MRVIRGGRGLVLTLRAETFFNPLNPFLRIGARAGESVGRLQSYVIFRPDRFVVYTKPITRERAEWLLKEAYYKVKLPNVREEYLRQWGSVMRDDLMFRDVAEVMVGVYTKDEFMDRLKQVAGPMLMQMYERLLERPPDPRPLQREPRPPAPPIRFYRNTFRHLVFDDDSVHVVPKSLWFGYVEADEEEYYGVSVFRNTFWLWRQDDYWVRAVVVRTDVAFDDVVNYITAQSGNSYDLALAVEFLKENGGRIAEVLDEKEEEMAKLGLGHVADAAKSLIVVASMLT